MRRLTLAEFIRKAKDRHPAAGYGYDKFVYVDSRTKGTITCPAHGDFEQAPGQHILGTGCKACGWLRTGQSRQSTREAYIAKAKLVHPDAGYTYDRLVYVEARSKGVITCPVHGDFEQKLANHLTGNGCPVCADEQRAKAHRTTLAAFIASAKAAHSGAGYGYDKFVYVNARTPGIITCSIPTHRDFSQTPDNHLRGQGCPGCAGRISRPCTAWLDDLGVLVREHTIRLPGRRKEVVADGYDPATDTVYEFRGDYYHGNPAMHAPDEWVSQSKRITFGQWNARSERKLADLRRAGFNVVTIWESEFRAANPDRVYAPNPVRIPKR